MAAFLVRRIALGLLVLWVMTAVVFVMFFVAPHNVANLIAGRQATPETVALVKHRLGLDRPVLDQYRSYMWNLLHGNLGYSFYNSSSVRSLIWQRVPVTFSLALGAALLWLVMGVSAGVLAATRPRSKSDRTVTVTALFFYSMPSFLLGVIIFYLLFYRLHLAGIGWFPGNGYVAFTDNPWRWGQHLILPWFTLALVTAAAYARLTRGSMLDVLGEDYIRTARAKGLTERRVVYRHGLRAALTPVVTQFGIDFGTLLGGVIIVENIFGLPGLGQQAVQSVLQQDLPVVIGTIVVAAAFIVVANILVDICYGILDPRVRVH
ncbi:MAG TPA: ABC transporter permease [Gaiellaceae bacterium]|nr:ABC transporter permease [Gaiellaceae bacterium]